MYDNYTGPPKAPDASLKKVIRVKRDYQSFTYSLDGTVDEVIQRLQELKSEVEEGSNLHLSFEKVYGQWGDDDSYEVALYDERIETDQECRIRLQNAEQAVKDKRATQMAQLAHLKKELGED